MSIKADLSFLAIEVALETAIYENNTIMLKHIVKQGESFIDKNYNKDSDKATAIKDRVASIIARAKEYY